MSIRISLHHVVIFAMMLSWSLVQTGSSSNSCTLDGGKTGFLCTSGVCVDSLFRCDGLAQCYDSSDERNCCDATAPLRGKYFLCRSGKCISARLRCDEEVDCNTNLRQDDSDEEGCLHLSTIEISLIIMFIVLLLALLVYKVVLKRRPRCLKQTVRLPPQSDFLTSARNTTVHHESSCITEVDDQPGNITQQSSCPQSALPILDSIQISAPPAYHIAVSRSYPRPSTLLSLSAIAGPKFTTTASSLHYVSSTQCESPPPSYEEVQSSPAQYKMVRTEGLAICTSSSMQVSHLNYEHPCTNCSEGTENSRRGDLPTPID